MELLEKELLNTSVSMEGQFMLLLLLSNLSIGMEEWFTSLELTIQTIGSIYQDPGQIQLR